MIFQPLFYWEASNCSGILPFVAAACYGRHSSSAPFWAKMVSQLFCFYDRLGFTYLSGHARGPCGLLACVNVVDIIHFFFLQLSNHSGFYLVKNSLFWGSGGSPLGFSLTILLLLQTESDANFSNWTTLQSHSNQWISLCPFLWDSIGGLHIGADFVYFHILVNIIHLFRICCSYCQGALFQGHCIY